MFEIGQISHPGRKRLLNEDTYDLDACAGLAVLVDGMGGQQSLSPSGASAIAARFSDGFLDLAWVGTCTVLFSDGRQYCRIQSDAESKGVLKSGAGNAIQALGVTATDKLCISETGITLKRGESVLFCTDGVLEACSEPELETSLCDPRLSAQESVEILLMHALRGEAVNNLTALLLRRA